MTSTLTDAQVNVYADDLEALALFYRALGMDERFRFPATGAAEHIEVSVGTFTLGLTSREALTRLTGLATEQGPSQSEVVLWCNDVAALFEKAQQCGASALVPPKVFNGRIEAAWVQDPEGNRVKLVASVEPENTLTDA
ncbi:VOC family protein [Saccharospirillum mangrovi]|uniref:VOC family protein n=1 Tax=Saccharospirillum mangrovi TaxID=2161747 RepID=UPI000D3AB76F|nr:VOC family protein [Saccharospirillum mangrovi]